MHIHWSETCYFVIVYRILRFLLINREYSRRSEDETPTGPVEQFVSGTVSDH